MSDVIPLAVPTREQIEALQAVVAKLPQVECPTRHYFADGMYCREMIVPAGTVIVGKVHKREHFLLVLKGSMAVTTDTGVELVSAPAILIGKPGTKRAGVCIEDMVVVNMHRTNLTDVEQIERELIEPDETALLDAYNRPKHLLEVA